MAFKSKIPPLCRCCGKPIRKLTITVYLRDRPLNEYENSHVDTIRYLSVPKLPDKIDECRRMTNLIVVSVERCKRVDTDTDKACDVGIGRFYEWDGESYDDEFFCSGSCAKEFGYFAMRHPGRTTQAYSDAITARRAKDAS